MFETNYCNLITRSVIKKTSFIIKFDSLVFLFSTYITLLYIMQGKNSYMKIKASPCLFNHEICLEAVSSGTEVDAINVGGQIPDIYRRLDRRDASRAGDKRSTHQPVVTDVTATIGNTGFRVYGAFYSSLRRKSLSTGRRPRA